MNITIEKDLEKWKKLAEFYERKAVFFEKEYKIHKNKHEYIRKVIEEVLNKHLKVAEKIDAKDDIALIGDIDFEIRRLLK